MNIKTTIKSLIPSFRATQPIMEYCHVLYEEIKRLQEYVKESIRVLDDKNEYLFWLSQRLPDETFLETKKRVFLGLPKAYGQLRDIQLADNFILQKTKQYADELNISFFLTGGTALGAVRHKGFIPWDDRISVGMLQDDYEKLKKRIDQDGVLTAQRCYLANGSSRIRVKLKDFESFFIDIFAFEVVHADASEIDDYWKHSQALTEEYCNLVKAKFLELNLQTDLAEEPVYSAELDEYATSVFQDLQKKLPKKQSKDSFVWGSMTDGSLRRDRSRYIPYDDAFPVADDAVEFEGKTYGVFHDCEKYLKNCFGDIWRFPRNVSSHHREKLNSNVRVELQKLKELNMI